LSTLGPRLIWAWVCRNQGPAPTEPIIEMSEQELENVSKDNVRRWVSAHIIPVRDPSPSLHSRPYINHAILYPSTPLLISLTKRIIHSSAGNRWLPSPLTEVMNRYGQESLLKTARDYYYEGGWCCLLLLLLTDSRHICLRFLLGVFSALTPHAMGSSSPRL
jgi:hypothetical protein